MNKNKTGYQYNILVVYVCIVYTEYCKNHDEAQPFVKPIHAVRSAKRAIEIWNSNSLGDGSKMIFYKHKTYI